MSDDLAAAVAAVRERVTPDPDQRERLAAVTDRVVERARSAAADLPVEADVLRVGSTARDTWTPDDRDIDVFVRFPPTIEREALERYGLEVGRTVLPDGEEAFAEHPYVRGRVDGFEVDLVPCYRVEAAREARTAVDRTPFHTHYIEAAITDELAADVRVLKQFLRGRDIYGSDLRTRGFSGYLTELLVIEYGGFVGLIQAAADWRPPVVIDPEGHGTVAFDDPLVVIDPTDPERNVAAVVSTTNLARFQHHARALLEDPSVERFFPAPPAPLSRRAMGSHLEDREATLVALRFEAPAIVDDQLYPQLDKSLRGLERALEGRGFDVLRSDRLVGEGEPRPAVLLFELATARLPAVERHVGPPVAVREHARAFYEKYADRPVYGPFVDGDRYVVERPREQPSALGYLREGAVREAALGPAVERALARDYEVLVDEEALELTEDESIAVGLSRYFDPRP